MDFSTFPIISKNCRFPASSMQVQYANFVSLKSIKNGTRKVATRLLQSRLHSAEFRTTLPWEWQQGIDLTRLQFVAGNRRDIRNLGHDLIEFGQVASPGAFLNGGVGQFQGNPCR